jgi:site-specific recombinase XerD
MASNGGGGIRGSAGLERRATASLIAWYENDRLVKESKMLLKDLFDGMYRPLRLRGRSANTTRLYGCTIRAFGRWLGYEPTVDDLTDLMLSQYLDHRASDHSPYTAEKERSQLCSLWRFAADRGIVPTRPEVQ